ncbi:Fibroblast growth factor 11 [Bagarius yarrelli]|uniref:Fibroblast growth factor 11 n=1 Tax=Bagarius yarrelli TaxID=175774 RepID=A0A556U6B0_BAGYA|nr:Fibroblast growth factor 11 [Bagarius yarrelli]
MAALASSLIRQRREVKDQQANRQISNKRKPCPKSNKSLCQKQILILISKVRLCGSRGRKLEKRPGEWNKSLVAQLLIMTLGVVRHRDTVIKLRYLSRSM